MQLGQTIVKSLLKKFEGDIEAHKVNVQVMLENTVGVGEHSNITETVEKELDIIAGYEDKIAVIKKYFEDN